MTYEELKYRQSWSLGQKIDHTLGAIEAFLAALAERGARPYISFSGGKDSTVLVDLIRRTFDRGHRIPVVYCNTGNEWPEVMRFAKSLPDVEVIRPKMTVAEVLGRYGFPLISKEQAGYIREVRNTKCESVRQRRLVGSPKYQNGCISQCWRFLIYAPFATSDKCCDILKKRPFAQYERETGRYPILGTMAEESDRRQGQYLRRGGCNALAGDRLASHPMSIWVERDVWEYKSLYNIPFSPIYDNPLIHQTGCMFCGFGAQRPEDHRFEILYDLHPKAYAHFMGYTNNGITYREALRRVGVALPDEQRQLKLFDARPYERQ